MRFFLSPTGRMSRGKWLTLALPSVGLPLIIACLIDYILGRTQLATESFLLWVGLILLWPGIALASRRMHDVNQTALRLLVFPILFIVAVVIFNVEHGFTYLTAWGMWVVALLALYPAALIFTLSTTRGDRGPNRFGPDPLAVRGGGKGP